MATTRSVLVVTATSGFGELIQQTLEETGLYKVMLASSAQEALLCIQTVSFSLTILDSELMGGNIIPLASSIRQKLPSINLILLCAEGDAAAQAALALRPTGLLSKPCYLPELLDTVAKALQTPIEPARVAFEHPHLADPNPGVNPIPPLPEWLQDANWASQQLTRLSLKSSAQAATIVRKGVIWAYAGGLSQLAAQELVDHLAIFLDGMPEGISQTSHAQNQRGDIVRFVRLKATNGDYMLYATPLCQGMLLALVFDSGTPFTSIRTQTSYFARALLAPPGIMLPPSPNSKTNLISRMSMSETGELSPGINLPPLLEDVPPPKAPSTRQVSHPLDLSDTWEGDQATGIASPDISSTSSAALPGMPKPSPTAPSSSSTPGSMPRQQDEQLKPVMVPDLLPSTPTLHYLSYSCTLIPRLPHHLLDMQLAQHLQEWLPQIFLAFGWQLLQVGVYPEYMQIIARVTPNISPGGLLHTIRKQTSQRIFSAFPLLAQDNPSGDFWAPGYLIISSTQPPDNHVIQYYIEQTRLQQGIRKTGK